MPLRAEQVAKLKAFGANVRRERDRLTLTQGKLAEKVGIHPRALQKIEAGAVDASLSTVIQIQKALKCEWKDLLGSL